MAFAQTTAGKLRSCFCSAGRDLNYTMPLQPRCLPPIVLLVIAANLFVAIEAFLIGKNDWWPAPSSWLLPAVAVSQISLIAIWAAFGRTPRSLRLLLLSVSLVGWTCVMDCGGHYSSNWLIRFVGLSVPLLAVCMMIRLWGVQLQARVHSPRPSDLRPTQFTFTRLLLWMLCLSIFFGLARIAELRWYLNAQSWDSEVFGAFVLGLGHGAIGIICIWGAFQVHNLVVKLAGLILLVLIVAYTAGAIAVGLQRSWVWGYTMIDYIEAEFYVAYMQAILVLGTLFAFRVAGYRFVRTPRRTTVNG